MTSALALATALEVARIVSIHAHAVDGRPAVRITAVGDLSGVAVRRELGEVVVSLVAEAPDIPAPPGLPPMEAIRIEREPPGTTVHIKVAPEVPFELRRSPGVLEILFGEASALPTAPAPDVAELYRRIFPAPGGEGGGEEEGGAQVVGGEAETAKKDESGGSFHLGNASLRPSVAASYVDARNVVVQSPEPFRDSYFQVQPRLAAEMPLRNGSLKVAYEARFRRGASVALLETTSHLVDASLELPLGSRLTMRAGDHYTKGLLETTEVDPGKEFFFGLGRFHRNQAEVGARIEAGGRVQLELGATQNVVRFDESAGFFDYDTSEGRAELSYELTPDVRAGLAYAYDRTPPPFGRPQVESRSHSALLTLRGELSPLTTAQLAAGFEDVSSPRAATGGTSYRGLSGTLSLSRQLSRTANATLSVSRATRLSGFEDNAFYLANDLQGQVNLPLPFSCSLALGAGYHWNQYRTVAAGLGEPREDRIFGWAVGIGRPVTRHAYLRIDYRKERRDSNIDAFDTRSEALIVQLGFGLFGAQGRP